MKNSETKNIQSHSRNTGLSAVLKGEFDGICNRKVCEEKPAKWFNHSTRKYYCRKCAETINRHNQQDAFRLFGHDLCTFGEE